MNSFPRRMKTKSMAILALLGIIVTAGVLFAWWTVERTDHEMRKGLLEQARLMTQTVNVERVKALSGSEVDLASPGYLNLKDQLAITRKVNPQCRFLYLMGRKSDGALFFLVDSEPAGSKDYSPPGQVYDEASAGFRLVFDTGRAIVEGPVSDRWGTWVSALVPLTDPQTGAVLAVLGLDIDARDWKWEVAAKAALPVGLLLVLLMGLACSFASTLRVNASPKPVLRRLLPPLVVTLMVLVAGSGALLWRIQEQRLQEIIAREITEVPQDLRTALDLEASVLAAALKPIAADAGLRKALRERDADRLLSAWRPLFDTLHKENNITHFYFLDTDRVCLLRLHKPEKRGDRIDRFTALEAERMGKAASGIELGPLGTFTLRAVQPVFSDGKLVGYIELGKEIEEVLQSLQGRSGVHMAVVIHKEHLNRQSWEKGMRLLGREADWDRFSKIVVICASQGRLPDEFAPLADHEAAGDHLHGAITTDITSGGKEWRASPVPLRDAAGKEVGDLLIMRDISAEKASFTRQINLAGVTAVALLSLLLGGVYVLLDRTDRSLLLQQAELTEHESRMRATLRSIGDGVISTDTEGRVTNLNAVAEMLTGWSMDEARGRPVLEVFRIINAQTRAEAENPVARALQEGVVVGLANHTALIARDGTEWQIADSCAPIRGEAGAILGAVLVFRDVTEEYRRREKLRLSEEKFRALNEKLAVGVVMIGPNMELLAINPRMREWFPDADYDQQPLCYYAFNVPARNEPCVDCPVQKTLLDGQTHIAERKAATPKGIRFLRLTATAITDPDGTVTAAIEMVEDITARKQTEALLRARLKLVEFAASHTLDALLQKTLDEVGDLTESPIGFYHFVEADQKTLTLQAWSTRTIKDSAEGKGAHYGIDQAGVWVDCVHQRKPVIYNDYASLPHKKGLPPGHAAMVRELVVPIMRSGRCVAIIGVGNKPTDYTDRDVEIVSLLADVAWEVTSRKRQEEALKQSEERLRTITESAQDAILMMDAQGRITFWNPAAASIFGYSRDEALGRNLHDLLAPERYLEAHRKAFPEFVRTGRGNAIGKTIELAGRRKDGQEIPVALSLSVISLEGQWHAVGIIRDITAQKQAEANLLETNHQLEEAIARANTMAVQAELASIAKSEFLANVSHEVRTPMNGVIGMTGLLLDTELNEEQRRYAEILRASGESMLSVINDILDFSKIEAGKLDLETLDFDLVSLLDDFAATLSGRAYEKGIELLCSVDPEVPALLRGDPGRLRQILTNLTGNAIKFTHQGEVAVHVSLVSSTDTEAVLRFSVRDTGIGIPKDKLGLVFDKFTQVDASTTRRYGGTGLGLAISKQLAELMGGEVGVDSKEGRGSEFWFTVRLARQFEGEKAPTPLLADLRGVRVLVVDDNATSREILSVRLTSWGMRPEAAPDGPAALQALYQALDTADPFRIAVLDMQMPGMDGEALARTIRADNRLADIRLVMMTSLGERGDARRFEEIGFAAYLTKPIRHSELFNVLSAVMADGVPRPQPKPFITRHSVRDQMRLAVKAGARILLAEDNITNQQVALGILNKLGLRADAVANGAEVLKALETIPYDLVLMDVQMPVMDGLEATSQIRNPQFPIRNHGIPIIAMTAHALQGDRERFLEAGMNDYVSKPIEPQALAKALERWLPQKGQRQKAEGEKVHPLAVQTVFDHAGLMARLMDDQDLLRTIIEGFLEDIPQQILALQGNLAAGDAAATERQAHTIKGAAANVGGEALREVAGEMEKAAKTGDLAAVAARVPELEKRFEQLKQMMQEEGP